MYKPFKPRRFVIYCQVQVSGYIVTSTKPKIILFDTNVWRYLSDSKEVGRFLDIQKKFKGDKKVAVAPTTIYEIANLKDKILKKRLLRVACNPAWHRFLTDSFIQSEQLFVEIKELCPHWLRDSDQTPLYDRLKYDYERRKGGWWDQMCRADGDLRRTGYGLGPPLYEGEGWNTSQEAQQERALRIVKDAKRIKEVAAQEGMLGFRDLPFKKVTADLPHSGFEHIKGDYWRVQNFLLFSQWREGGSRDWLFERVNLDFLSRNNPDYVKFWMELVRPSALSSHWIPSFFNYKSYWRKVNYGTGADLSLAAYAIHADYFVSADKVFCDLLSEAHEEADFKVATPTLIKGSRQGILELIQKLESASFFS